MKFPTNYSIDNYDADMDDYEIFISYKKLSPCYSGLKHPIFVGQVRNFPESIYVQISNDDSIPWGVISENNFIIDVRTNIIINPENCHIDERDLFKIQQWINKNTEKLNFLHQMFKLKTWKITDIDSNISYDYIKILNSLKAVRRKSRRLK